MGKILSKQGKQRAPVEITEPARRTYRTPELIQWGCVRDLTREGGGLDDDAHPSGWESQGDFF